MASIINASNTTGGIIATGDGSGILELQSGGTTALTANGANVTVAGTLTASGGISGISSPFTIAADASAGAEIRLPEDTDNGSNYVAVKAPNSLASNITLTLPTTAGTSGQFLQTDGSGALTFASVAPGGDASNNNVDAVGYKGLPQNSQTASYTLALADMGKHISITTGGVIIPANGSVAFPVGSAVTIYNNSGSSQTISITTDTLRQAGTANTGSRTLAQYGLATVLKVSSTVWVISGAGVS